MMNLNRVVVSLSMVVAACGESYDSAEGSEGGRDAPAGGAGGAGASQALPDCGSGGTPCSAPGAAATPPGIASSLAAGTCLTQIEGQFLVVDIATGTTIPDVVAPHARQAWMLGVRGDDVFYCGLADPTSTEPIDSYVVVRTSRKTGATTTSQRPCLWALTDDQGIVASVQDAAGGAVSTRRFADFEEVLAGKPGASVTLSINPIGRGRGGLIGLQGRSSIVAENGTTTPLTGAALEFLSTNGGASFAVQTYFAGVAETGDGQWVAALARAERDANGTFSGIDSRLVTFDATTGQQKKVVVQSPKSASPLARFGGVACNSGPAKSITK